jgi:uncharacterized lipoprotein YmbA
MPTRRATLLLAFAPLASCRSPEPVLYTIQPVPGVPRRGAPRAVGVREVSLARYLDRVQIVRATSDYRLDVAGNDWWGESLDAMLTRVLVENLASRLQGSNVFATGGAITTTPDATVEVNVQRLGLTSPATLALTAQIAVAQRNAPRRDLTRTESVTAPVAGADTAAFAAAASAAVGQLADTIATALAG